jgi:hypothetical protein
VNLCNCNQKSSDSAKKYHYYTAYGLQICSAIPLPELCRTEFKKFDLIIQRKQFELPPLTPTSIYRQNKQAYFGKSQKSAFLHWQDIASFQAQGGIRLNVMEVRPNIEPQLLNLYLLSESLGLILHQKGFLLLHGSAVLLEQGVIIFLGKPGAGKSTTAAAFAQKGYTVIADDLVALEINSQGLISIIPAFPQLKLWESAIIGLGYQPSQTQPLFTGSRKRVIKAWGDFPSEQKFPVLAIYVLETNSDLSIAKLTAQEGLIALTRFFSCPHQLLSGSDLSPHFQKCQMIVNQVHLYKILMPKRFSLLNHLIQNVV